MLSDINFHFKFFFYSRHNFDKHLRYSGELPQDVKEILDIRLSMETETVQLILNIRLLFDENTGHSRKQDRYKLTQGNAATLICSSMLFDLPYINAENTKYRRLQLHTLTVTLRGIPRIGRKSVSHRVLFLHGQVPSSCASQARNSIPSQLPPPKPNT